VITTSSGTHDCGAQDTYAAGQVERFAATPSDVKVLLAQAHKLRALLLTSADVLVLAGILPAASVAKIRQGKGSIDTAGDCVALAALFTKHADAITGKVPVTASHLQAADAVGSRLLRVLHPSSAKRPTDKELVAASDARDRLWTLFERTWEDHVWRAGAWLFGRDVDQFVPLLMSRVVGRRAAPVVAPVPPPAVVAAAPTVAPATILAAAAA